MRMLCHGRVQIVLDHHHYRGCLLRLCGIHFHRAGIHLVVGAETVHIYAPICAEFVYKLRCQFGMELLREISQCIPEGESLLFGGEYLLASGSMAH